MYYQTIVVPWYYIFFVGSFGNFVYNHDDKVYDGRYIGIVFPSDDHSDEIVGYVI